MTEHHDGVNEELPQEVADIGADGQDPDYTPSDEPDPDWTDGPLSFADDHEPPAEGMGELDENP